MASHRLSWTRLWAWCLLGLGVVLLSGCAATSVTSQVQSFGSWPEGRKPGTFAFDVLPSQQGPAMPQAKLQAAALPSLQALGFKLAPPDEAGRVEWLVQLDLQVSIEPRLRYEPLSPYPHVRMRPYGFPSAHPYAYGPLPPHWRGGFGWWGPGWVTSMDPPWVTLKVRVIVRDRHNGQVLYETRAAHDRLGSVDDTVLPYLFEAALTDFPNVAPGTRTVDIPLPQAPR